MTGQLTDNLTRESAANRLAKANTLKQSPGFIWIQMKPGDCLSVLALASLLAADSLVRLSVSCPVIEPGTL